MNLIGIESVAAIGAHPDDIELGCLGTLLKLDPSVKIYTFIGSLGSSGDSSSGMTRIGESMAAFECRELAGFNFRNQAGITQNDFVPLLDQLTGVLDEAKPDLILTQGPKDTHQEHRIIWEVTMAAARRTRASILHYAVASNTPDFTPNVFVDISEQYEVKKAALAKHQSQAGKEYMTDQHLDLFHGTTYASLHGIRCSEAFELFRGFF